LKDLGSEVVIAYVAHIEHTTCADTTPREKSTAVKVRKRVTDLRRREQQCFSLIFLRRSLFQNSPRLKSQPHALGLLVQLRA
jgi:hypothetical protein